MFLKKLLQIKGRKRGDEEKNPRTIFFPKNVGVFSFVKNINHTFNIFFILIGR